MRWFWRRRERLRAFDEASAYTRLHGKGTDSVTLVDLPPRRARYEVLATGEEIRRGFERRIDAREIEEEPSAIAPPVAQEAPVPAEEETASAADEDVA